MAATTAEQPEKDCDCPICAIFEQICTPPPGLTDDMPAAVTGAGCGSARADYAQAAAELLRDAGLTPTGADVVAVARYIEGDR